MCDDERGGLTIHKYNRLLVVVSITFQQRAILRNVEG
jgi:hypothetical protein